MQRLRRQLPFLRSVLQEANRMKRQDLLQHANADQINAVSELALNLLKNKIPVTPPIMAKLRPYKNVLDRPANACHVDQSVTRRQSGHRDMERRVLLLEA